MSPLTSLILQQETLKLSDYTTLGETRYQLYAMNVCAKKENQTKSKNTHWFSTLQKAFYLTTIMTSLMAACTRPNTDTLAKGLVSMLILSITSSIHTLSLLYKMLTQQADSPRRRLIKCSASLLAAGALSMLIPSLAVIAPLPYVLTLTFGGLAAFGIWAYLTNHYLVEDPDWMTGKLDSEDKIFAQKSENFEKIQSMTSMYQTWALKKQDETFLGAIKNGLIALVSTTGALGCVLCGVAAIGCAINLPAVSALVLHYLPQIAVPALSVGIYASLGILALLLSGICFKTLSQPYINRLFSSNKKNTSGKQGSR